MQCAQCHDHPLVDDYLQSDYHGLLAFVAPSYQVVRTVGDKQITVQAERAGTDLAFESVFVKVPRRTGRESPTAHSSMSRFFCPEMNTRLRRPTPLNPSRRSAAAPSWPNLQQVGPTMPSTETSSIASGRTCSVAGWCTRVDWQHSGNPPADAELLQTLAERFVAMNFDMRGFLREIALSNSYQRSFDLPTDLLCLSKQASGRTRPVSRAASRIRSGVDNFH